MPPKQVKIREDPEPEPIETSSNRSKLASLHSHSGKRHVLSWLAGHSRESAGDGPYQMLEDEPSSEGVQAGVRPRAATAAMNVLSAPMDPAIADALRGLRLESPSAMRRKSAGDEKATLFEMVDPAPEDAEGVHKPRSLVKLQRYLRSVVQEWVASCSPATFRVNDPAKLYPLPDFADYGMIQFPARADPARFIHLSASRLPYRSMNSYLKSVLDLMEKHWQIEPASVLISITGGAQDFKLQPRLLKAFKHGLAKAAQATNAWVFTGGTDSGVMQLVGEALSETQCSAKMIGVATWACVWGKERLEGCYGGTRDVVRERQNDRNHANLEPHHTHFILVDNGASPQRAFREAFAKAIKVQRWQVTLRVNDGVDVAMPPFHVTIIVSAAGMGEGTNTCNRLRKLSAASLSAALPEGSPVGEISNVEYDSQVTSARAGSFRFAGARVASRAGPLKRLGVRWDAVVLSRAGWTWATAVRQADLADPSPGGAGGRASPKDPTPHLPRLQNPTLAPRACCPSFSPRARSPCLPEPPRPRNDTLPPPRVRVPVDCCTASSICSGCRPPPPPTPTVSTESCARFLRSRPGHGFYPAHAHACPPFPSSPTDILLDAPLRPQSVCQTLRRQYAGTHNGAWASCGLGAVRMRREAHATGAACHGGYMRRGLHATGVVQVASPPATCNPAHPALAHRSSLTHVEPTLLLRKWGGEIELRASLEKLYCERRRVPRVTVVVNGGPGTLTTVHTAVMQGCPVVIISDSGGIATCLHE